MSSMEVITKFDFFLLKPGVGVQSDRYTECTDKIFDVLF